MGKILAAIFGFLALIALSVFISGLVVKLAWAYSIAEIFPGVGPITWTQAFALSLLGNALTGGIRVTKDSSAKVR
jgi:hypothetical protein